MLGIMLLTYNRLNYAKITLNSVLDNITYNGEIRVHIATDGDETAYVDELLTLAARHPKVRGLSYSNSKRAGYGANYNLATQVLHPLCDYILPLEDDWECVREFNTDLFLEGFQDARVNCIRMGYVGYTQELRGSFVSIAGKHWLLLDPHSPEPHVFAGHPRLERVSFQREVGPWPEGLLPGATEFAVAQRQAARTGVVWPCDLITPTGNLFAHIGAERSY